MLMDVDGCCWVVVFFSHLWPLGLPQRESSSLELVQNCQMLPPEHSCISVHTIHTTSYFLTLDWFIQTRPRERPERSQPVTSQCWSSQSSTISNGFPMDVRTVASPRALRRLFLGPPPSGPPIEAKAQPTPNQQGQMFKQRVMVNRC